MPALVKYEEKTSKEQNFFRDVQGNLYVLITSNNGLRAAVIICSADAEDGAIGFETYCGWFGNRDDAIRDLKPATNFVLEVTP